MKEYKLRLKDMNYRTYILFVFCLIFGFLIGMIFQMTFSLKDTIEILFFYCLIYITILYLSKEIYDTMGLRLMLVKK